MRCILEINVGLLSTADNSVPVCPEGGDGSHVDKNGRQLVDPQGFAEVTPLKTLPPFKCVL